MTFTKINMEIESQFQAGLEINMRKQKIYRNDELIENMRLMSIIMEENGKHEWVNVFNQVIEKLQELRELKGD